MTPGLYIKPPLLDSEGNEYDPGAAWDALATGDEIEWFGGSAQHQTPEFIIAPTHSDEIAPHQMVIGSGATDTNGNGNGGPPVPPQRLEDFKFGMTAESPLGHERSNSPSPQPSNGSILVTDSQSASGSSSSEHESSSAGTAESGNLDRDLAALALNSWLNRIQPDEIPILTTDAESRGSGLRQRASSIIPSVIPAVAPRRTHKKKKLLLTSERLLCLKLKENRPPVIKAEFVFDVKGITVERKGDKDFIVHCVRSTFDLRRPNSN
jgi:3-phosphoinositide dependent protein kinase-1